MNEFNITPELEQALVKSLLQKHAAASTVEPQASTQASRQQSLQSMMRKEAILAQALNTEVGLKKIAANMANPVRQKLDYKGITRKLSVVEQMPNGVPLIYDKDQQEVPAIKLAKSGSPGIIELRGRRVELKSFEIAANAKVPYSELYVRRFRSLDRAKDRLISGMELAEDLNWFSMAADLAGVVNTTIGLGASALTKDGLALGFAAIERWRLPVGAVLTSPAGVRGIRGWTFQYLDQVGMQAVRESGYLGNIWQAPIFVSDQIPAGSTYVFTTPKFLSWVPIYKDLDVIPADDPDNLRLGFVGYELLGMTLHNALGVVKLTFDPTL